MKVKDIIFDRIAGNFLAMFIGFFFISLSTYMNGDYGVWSGPAPIMIGIFLMCFWMTRLHAYREFIRIKNDRTINHLQRVAWRFSIASFISCVISYSAEGYNKHASLMAGVTTVYIGAIFWLLFDFMLNNDRNLAIFYVSKWYRSAWLDRVFKGDARWWLTSKVVVIVFAVWLYLKMFI